ncbi:hypothetical protein KPH14_003744 [Odynerus spinipes]|uniref:MD-2-related lipid-recognition domain-containing protein n=1 Tax=Odynerus spinipes TaxID=1348599 RepID=A0AAD9RX81_9HYME|nr:hypothetical protein KPH14_003744 [Odynerus spinipes]
MLLLLGLCVLRLDLVQSDLQIIIDNIDVEVDEEYFGDCEAQACENDEMIAEFSLDCKLIKTLPIDGTMKAILLGMVNGEPTEPTGIDMEMSMCQLVNDTIIGGPLFNAMKVEPKCPLEPTALQVECYNPPMDNFPDFFPPGEYKFTFDLTHDDAHLFLFEVYLTLY